MPVYAKKLSHEWRKAFEQYESVSGFEPMYQEDIDAGHKTPSQAWRENVRWLESVFATVINTKIPYEEDAA